MSDAPISLTFEHGIRCAEVTGVLERLPEWFGRPQAIANYARETEKLGAIVARQDKHVIGLLTLKPSSVVATEIALMAVAPEWHRQGIGRAMIETAVTQLVSRGHTLVWVQTVGPTYDDAAYAGTRAFYAAVGFAPLVEIPDHLGAGTPALLMVRPVA